MSSASRKYTRQYQQDGRHTRHSSRQSTSRVYLLQQGEGKDAPKVRQPSFQTNFEEEETQRRVMRQDTAYFNAHKDAVEYEREMIPGEVPRTSLHPEKHYKVRVRLVDKDTRVREFYEKIEEGAAA